MKMLLQLCAFALLVSAAISSPVDTPWKGRDNLNRVLELAEKIKNESFAEQEFVANVKALVGNCENKFFCHVHDVLREQERVTPSKHVAGIVRNLEQFLKHEHVNCTEIPQPGDSPRIQVRDLINELTSCIRQKNFYGRTRSN